MNVDVRSYALFAMFGPVVPPPPPQRYIKTYETDRGGRLNGNSTYKLTVPQPVPGKLFWSVTVYDNETRSEVVTDQNSAALRSLFELRGGTTETPLDLYFGSEAPVGHEKEWIRTKPGKGWFTYFRSGSAGI